MLSFNIDLKSSIKTLLGTDNSFSVFKLQLFGFFFSTAIASLLTISIPSRAIPQEKAHSHHNESSSFGMISSPLRYGCERSIARPLTSRRHFSISYSEP
ncbi:unnamed protein product [Larinioides sclopetarius]|uniref:Uncharacterized protein n=1 Tax=Larinioides sclopetarius TaxID=280406 RepID=A0AAV1YTK2_9ARAC